MLSRGNSILRSVAVVMAAVLLAYATSRLFGPAGEIVERAPGVSALLLLASLASIGTLLGRVTQACNFVIAAGALGLLDLAVSSAPHEIVIDGGAGAAAVLAIASGIALRRCGQSGHAP